MHKTIVIAVIILGKRRVKPSALFAKLFDAIPNIIPFAKNKYPSSGFIINYFQVNLPSLLQ